MAISLPRDSPIQFLLSLPVHSFPQTVPKPQPLSAAGSSCSWHSNWWCSKLSEPLLFKDYIYLFLDRGEGREKERERHVIVWLPLMCSLLGIWSTIQACALTGNWTSVPLVCRLALNLLNHTSQGISEACLPSSAVKQLIFTACPTLFELLGAQVMRATPGKNTIDSCCSYQKFSSFH